MHYIGFYVYLTAFTHTCITLRDIPVLFTSIHYDVDPRFVAVRSSAWLRSVFAEHFYHPSGYLRSDTGVGQEGLAQSLRKPVNFSHNKLIHSCICRFWSVDSHVGAERGEASCWKTLLHHNLCCSNCYIWHEAVRTVPFPRQQWDYGWSIELLSTEPGFVSIENTIPQFYSLVTPCFYNNTSKAHNTPIYSNLKATRSLEICSYWLRRRLASSVHNSLQYQSGILCDSLLHSWVGLVLNIFHFVQCDI